MSRSKFDGVVDAVHYKSDGQVDWVRAYLRRGPTFSDHVLLSRQNLIDQLKAKKVFLAGERIPQLASTFEVTLPIRLVSQDGKEILVTGNVQSSQDRLEGVPVI